MTFQELLDHLKAVEESDPELLEDNVTVLWDNEAHSLDLAMYLQERCLYFSIALLPKEDS